MGIAVTLYQAVVTAELPCFRMFVYGTFEIQDSKVVNRLQIRATVVYYKSNKGLIAAMDFICTFSPQVN
jgi:hypothetical protein